MPGNPPENYTGRESEEPIVWGTSQQRKSAGSSDKHYTCGHWHRVVPGALPGCLEFINSLNGAPFGLAGPRCMVPSTDGYLYSFQSGSTTYSIPAVLKKIDTATMTVVASKEYDPIIVYDLQEWDGFLWAATGTWLIKIDKATLESISSMYLGDTTIGTDGKFYYAIASSVRNYVTTPITGIFWTYAWKELPAGYPFYVAPWYEPGNIRIAGTVAPVVTDTYIYCVTWGTTFTTVTKFLRATGETIAFSPNLRTRISNLAINPTGTKLAVLYGKTGYTYDPGYIDIIDTSDMSLLVDAKWLATWNSGTETMTSSVVFHRNGYIYCCWQEDNAIPGRSLLAGVSKINWAGEVVATFDPQLVSFSRGNIVASTDYLFWWQSKLGNPNYGGIVKLDLDLNLICVEPFHFVLPSQPFQESAIAPFALTMEESKHRLYYLGLAGWYTQWYYYGITASIASTTEPSPVILPVIPGTPGLHLLINNISGREYFSSLLVADGLLLGEYGLYEGGPYIQRYLNGVLNNELRVTDIESFMKMLDLGDGSPIVSTEHYGRIYKRISGSWVKKYDTGSQPDLCLGLAYDSVADIVYGTIWPYVVSGGGYIISSTDKGLNWSSSAFSGLDPYGIAYDGTQVYVAGQYGGSAVMKNLAGVTLCSTPMSAGGWAGWWGICGKDGVWNLGTVEEPNASIWAWDGATLTKVHTTSRQYIHAMGIYEGVRYAVASWGWDTEGPTSLLLHSTDGYTWTTLCEIPCSHIMGMSFSAGTIYLTGGKYRAYGRVYIYKLS